MVVGEEVLSRLWTGGSQGGGERADTEVVDWTGGYVVGDHVLAALCVFGHSEKSCFVEGLPDWWVHPLIIGGFPWEGDFPKKNAIALESD